MAEEGRPYNHFWLLLLGLMAFSSTHPGVHSCSSLESEALLTLKGEDTFNVLWSWKRGSNCCIKWAGVTCDTGARHVISLDLNSSLSLQGGVISPSLCDLHNLQHLSITGFEVLLDFHGTFVQLSNTFDGQIPACLWNMRRLRYLAMTGLSLPDSLSQSLLPSARLCNLKSLAHIDMSGTYLHGSFPNCVWNMTKLEYLDLSSSDVSSSFSNSFSNPICNLKSLTHLGLSDIMHLDGSLPACIWNMTKLTYLDLTYAKVSASFSAQVCNLQNLAYLYMSGGFRDRYLPACVWNMTKIKEFQIVGGSDSELVFQNIPAGAIAVTRSLESLTFDTVGIHGSLPEWMQNLSRLESLTLSSNMITTFPGWIGKLPHLQVFDMSSNMITVLPQQIQVRNLNSLDLSNNLIQDVPESLGNLSQLNGLYLSDNLITAIPTFSGNLSALQYLYLSNNALKELHLFLGPMKNLQYLDLSDNPIEKASMQTLCPLSSLNSLSLSNISLVSTFDFTPILDCLGNSSISELEELDLSANYISGEFSSISNRLRNLSNLSGLLLSSNNLSGDLSTISSGFPTLRSLDVSNNRLTGELPLLLSSPPPRVANSPTYWSSRYLNVSGNQLGGRVSEFQWGKSLGLLDLSSNNFEGQLPPFLLSTFSMLVLSNNNFNGSIPAGLAKSVGLGTLDLSRNKLGGQVPAFLGTFRMLQVLDLTSNRFTGGLPSSLGNCSLLQRLRVGNNSLSGHVPDSLGRIGKHLLSLSLHSNDFEGNIPPSLSNCINLEVMDLSNNRLDGKLPPSFQRLSASLRVLIVASNRLSGDFPAWIMSGNFTSLQVLDLSNNLFEGSLPADFSKLHAFINGTNIENDDTLYDEEIQISAKGGLLDINYIVSVRTSLDVSNNQITGFIPEHLGDLRALLYLTLSGNKFYGPIPVGLSNLSKLESLDLSSNNLSGSLPPELRKISGLSYFNVSNNRLTGPIPKGGQFDTFNESSFQNNTGLCGFPLANCDDVETPATAPLRDRFRVGSWISLPGFITGFATSFTLILSIFALSQKARSILYIPRRKVKRVYQHREPYGAYVPRV